MDSMFSFRQCLSGAILAGQCALFAFSAHAAVDWTWTLNSAPVGTNLPGTTSVTGYSAPNNSAGLVSTTGAGLPDLTWYSGGYGICSTSPGDPNCRSPNHALDNSAAYESVLLSFGKAVTLSWLDIGWKYNDSDLSVLAYTGTGTPVLEGASYGGLLGSGWTLIGQYSNVPVKTATTHSLSFGTEVSSSYWLIGAYNSVFLDNSWGESDYVKLLAVAGNTTPPGKVSEPAVMMLFATGLLGMLGLRRRRYGACAV